MRHFLLPLFALFFLIAFLNSSCGKKESPAAATVATNEAIPVRTAPVQQKTWSIPIRTSGWVTSTAEQRLSFKIGGIIRKIYVEEGDVVRAGQLLAVLDKTEIDAQVTQAQQMLTKAERDLGRAEGLFKDSSATLEILENARTGREMAKENARVATFNQQYAEIRATKGGKIIKKLMNEGEVTGPGTPVLVLFKQAITIGWSRPTSATATGPESIRECPPMCSWMPMKAPLFAARYPIWPLLPIRKVVCMP